MPVSSLVLAWLFITSSWLQVHCISTSLPSNESDVLKKFYARIARDLQDLLLRSETEDATTSKSETRRLRDLIPETIAREREKENIYGREDVVNGLLPNRNSPFYNSNGIDGINTDLDFGGHKEFIFRPRYPCDFYDSSQRRCVLRRQVGTSLTLGVVVGEGLGSGRQIQWHRYLRKKDFEHVITEPLNKGFLPWNLNLGGSSNELRISPISEVDLSYNYFMAELVNPPEYGGKSKKISIRFEVELIEKDMGPLYPGEEIVIYARAFMELPRTSVSFSWSLQEKDDLEDHGLPSNMQLVNAERSSVIIKELKTLSDHYLVCKVFSNKNFLLAKRTFQFRGFGRNKTSATSTNIRVKRHAKDTVQPPNPMQFKETWDPEFSAATAFYNNRQKKPHIKMQDSDNRSFRSEDAVARLARRFLQKDENEINQSYRTEELSHSEKLRFEDIESQAIATCKTHLDCNIRATCVRESNYGQNYCRCLHGFNGNGLFCFRN